MKDPTRRKKQKLKLVVSYNGGFRRLPSSGKLRYAGGEAKIISVDRHITLSSLEAKIAGLFVVRNDAAPFSLSYLLHLADEDERPVDCMDSDDDVRRMITDFEKLEAIGKRCRLWVFVCSDDSNNNKSFHMYRNVENGYDKKLVLDANRENLMTRLCKSEKDKKFGDGLLRKMALKQQLVAKHSYKTCEFYVDGFEINGNKSDDPVIDLRSEDESGLNTESKNSAVGSEWYRLNMLDYEYRKINAVENEKFGEVLHVPVSNSRALNAKDGNLQVGLGGPMMGLSAQTRLDLYASSVHYAKLSNSNMNPRTHDLSNEYDLRSVELACLSNVNRENILPFRLNCGMVRSGLVNCSRSNQLVGVANRMSSSYVTKKAWGGLKSGVSSHRFGSSEIRNLQSCPYYVRNRENVNEMGNHHNFRLDRRAWPGRVHPPHGLSSNIPKPGEAATEFNSKLLDVKADADYKTFSNYQNATRILQDDIVPPMDISLHNLSLSSKGVEFPVPSPARSDISEALKMPEPRHYRAIDEEHSISELLFGKSSVVASESSSPCDAKTEIHNLIDEENQRSHLLDTSIRKKDEVTDGTISSKANGRTSAEIAAFYSHLAAGALQTIKNSDLEYIKELGSGACGTVYHGKWKGSDVAIKKIKPHCFTDGIKEEDRLVADFWKEAHMLGQLHHPNVVALYGVVTDGPVNNLATVTEYMVNGSLKQVLHRKDRTIDRRKRLIIARDAAFGMEYLHEKNIVHFDLKSHNLLVNTRDPQRPVCKIGDLGLSKIKQRTLVSGGLRGTIPWMAPELFNAKSMVTEKVDVFSFGIVMWELLTGEEPYANLRSEEIIGGIIKDSLRPETPSWCDPAWRSLMESCWSSDPDNRPCFLEVAKELRAMAAAANIK